MDCFNITLFINRGSFMVADNTNTSKPVVFGKGSGN